MKYIVLLLGVFLASGCDASTTLYKVECNNPNHVTTDTFSEKEVDTAYTHQGGTRITLNSGTVVDYSISVPCTVVKREVESK